LPEEKIGLSYVIGFGPSTATEMVESAILAEKNGFDSVFVPEHYYDREAPSILGAIARSTSNIRVGTGVINPFTRYPSLLAMTIATLDELSGGRAVLGLGSGGVIGSASHGIPNEFSGQKFARPVGHLREAVEIIRSLLAGDNVNYEGKFYCLKNVKLNVKPMQSSIPIYFGQQGPKMMELAGEIADGVLITLCCTIPYIKEVIHRVEKTEEVSRRRRGSVEFAARIITSLSDNGKDAIRFAKPLVGRVFIHPGAKPVMDASGFDLDVKALKESIETGNSEKLYELVPDEVVELCTASGTKNEIRDRIEAYREAGITLPLIVPINKNYADIIKNFSAIG
jgi:5,10-methylenetetrahydromethanopterin reductase